MINFHVDVKPMGAVRMTQRSKWVNSRAQQYLSYKALIGVIAKQHFIEPATGPISINIMFYYPVPESWSKVRKIRALNGSVLPIVKPDLDNCVKGIYDALNKKYTWMNKY